MSHELSSQPIEKTNRLENKSFWEKERVALVKTLEDLVTDPNKANLRLDINIPAIVAAGSQVDGTYFVDESVSMFAMRRNYSAEEIKTLREKVLNPFFIIEPIMDKNFTIGFVGHEKIETIAYNSAVKTVLDVHGMNPFHQLGSHEETGEQEWEVWQETTAEAMQALIPEIEAMAKEKLVFWREMYKEY